MSETRCAYCVRLMSPGEFRNRFGICAGCMTPSPDELDPRRVESVFDDPLWWEREQIAEMRGTVE